jgi:hypothetical protein
LKPAPLPSGKLVFSIPGLLLAEAFFLFISHLLHCLSGCLPTGSSSRCSDREAEQSTPCMRESTNRGSKMELGLWSFDCPHCVWTFSCLIP